MIISHRHQYVFIELPLTASTAIAQELMDNYEGEAILYKHANYRKFLKQASSAEKEYLPFIGIRNPLDKAVSQYHKYKVDHKNKYSDPRPRRSGRLTHWLNSRKHSSRFKEVQSQEISFNQFFLENYSGVYTDWSVIDKERMKAIIHFESLQDDFSRVLNLIGIKQKRPLPQLNRTESKDHTFWEYFSTPQMRKHAALIFGPYMNHWGYDFPIEWEVNQYQTSRTGIFNIVNSVKKFYWIYA